MWSIYATNTLQICHFMLMGYYLYTKCISVCFDISHRSDSISHIAYTSYGDHSINNGTALCIPQIQSAYWKWAYLYSASEVFSVSQREVDTIQTIKVLQINPWCVYVQKDTISEPSISKITAGSAYQIICVYPFFHFTNSISHNVQKAVIHNEKECTTIHFRIQIKKSVQQYNCSQREQPISF